MIRSTVQGNSEVKNKYLEVKSEVYNLIGIVSKGTLTLFTKMQENVTDYFTMIGTQTLVQKSTYFLHINFQGYLTITKKLIQYRFFVRN